MLGGYLCRPVSSVRNPEGETVTRLSAVSRPEPIGLNRNVREIESQPHQCKNALQARTIQQCLRLFM